MPTSTLIVSRSYRGVNSYADLVVPDLSRIGPHIDLLQVELLLLLLGTFSLTLVVQLLMGRRPPRSLRLPILPPKFRSSSSCRFSGRPGHHHRPQASRQFTVTITLCAATSSQGTPPRNYAAAFHPSPPSPRWLSALHLAGHHRKVISVISDQTGHTGHLTWPRLGVDFPKRLSQHTLPSHNRRPELYGTASQQVTASGHHQLARTLSLARRPSRLIRPFGTPPPTLFSHHWSVAQTHHCRK